MSLQDVVDIMYMSRRVAPNIVDIAYVSRRIIPFQHYGHSVRVTWNLSFLTFWREYNMRSSLPCAYKV